MTMNLCSELEAAAPGQLGGVSLRPPQHVPQAAALHEPEQGRNVRAMLSVIATIDVTITITGV